MRLILLHGPPASGKLTIARRLAAETGDALFHNHLVVDTVAALFPFGSPSFVRLRERMWRDALVEAAQAGRDTIFTFAPEPTVRRDFIASLLGELRELGARVHVVALTLPDDEQDRRLVNTDRMAFGKLTDTALLRDLRMAMAACSAAMPPADLTIDTSQSTPDEAVARIIAELN